jgi:menaquinone-dependent protoporphyrinogen oxidase
MRILIAVASKHGSTREIADALGDEFRQAGVDAVAADVRDAPPVADYDAVVIGSALYMGRWLPAARRFVYDNLDALAARPVWLVSSGPLGDTARPAPGEAAHVTELLTASGARGHAVFAGKLDRDALGSGERLVTRLVKAPAGDFRDWSAIRSWAHEIAAALRQDAVAFERLEIAATPMLVG